MIRDATEGDIAQVVSLGHDAFDRGGYDSFVSFDPLSAARSARAFMESQNVAFVVIDHNRLVGMAAALIAPLYFNHAERLAQEIFWWIEPEHVRETSDLISALEKSAREKGATVMMIPALTASAGRLYRRMGYSPMEHYHMKVLT